MLRSQLTFRLQKKWQKKYTLGVTSANILFFGLVLEDPSQFSGNFWLLALLFVNEQKENRTKSLPSNEKSKDNPED